MSAPAIFIKSYPNDFKWLDYCLRSIQKFVTGYSEIVVAIPNGTSLPLTQERVVNVEERGNGYYWQMHVKMCADKYTDAEYIVFVDSDCCFNRKFDLAEMFSNGKPMLLRRKWSEAGDGICWKAPADKALNIDTPYDTMCCHPSIYRQDTLQGARRHIKQTHGMWFDDYVLAQERFIEFDTLGNYAIMAQSDKYEMIDCGGPGDIFPRPLLQHWSWGGMKPEILRELARILK